MGTEASQNKQSISRSTAAPALPALPELQGSGARASTRNRASLSTCSSPWVSRLVLGLHTVGHDGMEVQPLNRRKSTTTEVRSTWEYSALAEWMATQSPLLPSHAPVPVVDATSLYGLLLCGRHQTLLTASFFLLSPHLSTLFRA